MGAGRWEIGIGNDKWLKGVRGDSDSKAAPRYPPDFDDAEGWIQDDECHAATLPTFTSAVPYTGVLSSSHVSERPE
jgi:hypothetical protein